MTHMRRPNPVKKRRQHHVWQQYLKAWSVGGLLYVLMDSGIFPTGTTEIAVERDFYKIGRLTAADIALLRLLMIEVKGIHPLTRKNHEEFLTLVASPGIFEGETRELDEVIDTFRTNALEDYHSAIEASFLPLLERALSKDISFYSDEQSCITLFHYLATQHMRTKGIKVKTIETLQERSGIDVSRIQDIMTHMGATNTGLSLYLERKERQLVLVENTTDLEFITGDQPILNLHADGKSPPKTLSWYYPISPCLALLLPEVGEEPTVSTTGLTSIQVNDLNAKIVAASHRQVFAQSRSALEPYSKTS
jgi:hypothetical protein